jgi:putative membrane protein
VTLRWLVASFHLLALAVGVGAVTVRARALGRVRAREGLATVFAADNWWGLAGIVWITTGLWRAFGGLEKGAAYYLQQPLFHAKLGLVAVVLLLELWPMVTLIRWRLALRGAQPVDLARAGLFARISYVQLLLTLLIMFLATALARGIGI